MKQIIAVTMVMLFAIPAWAVSGNDLLTMCQTSVRLQDDAADKSSTFADHFRDGYCAGLVRGIGYASRNVCLPEGVTTIQFVRVVVKYLQDHPEKLNLQAEPLADTALSQAFPCKK